MSIDQCVVDKKEEASVVDLVVISKSWGEEMVLVQTNKYCGKKLLVIIGGQSSIHYHKKTDETLYIEDGNVIVDIYPDGYVDGTSRRVRYDLSSGQMLKIPHSIVHSFYGVSRSKIFEISNRNSKKDTYRINTNNSKGLNYR